MSISDPEPESSAINLDATAREEFDDVKDYFVAILGEGNEEIVSEYMDRVGARLGTMLEQKEKVAQHISTELLSDYQTASQDFILTTKGVMGDGKINNEELILHLESMNRLISAITFVTDIIHVMHSFYLEETPPRINEAKNAVDNVLKNLTKCRGRTC